MNSLKPIARFRWRVVVSFLFPVLLIWGVLFASPTHLDPSTLVSDASALAQSPAPAATRFELPPGLSRYRYDESAGDYLDEIARTEDGAFVQWPTYPVKIFIQSDNQVWFDAVESAVQEWTEYIPLRITPRREEAMVTIERSEQIAGISGFAAPLFYFAKDGSLQQTVEIRIGEYPRGALEVAAVARHEIGHALGLLGHSPDTGDLMFGGYHANQTGGQRAQFLPRITARDLNTLQRVYEQPTYMGLILPEAFRGPNLVPGRYRGNFGSTSESR